PLVAVKPAPRLDFYGDPLPEGAIARLGTLRWRSDLGTYHLRYAPDGKTLATASRSRVVLWDVSSGKPIRKFKFDKDKWSIGCFIFSPGGGLVAAGVEHPVDNSPVYLWDVGTWKEVGRFRGTEGLVVSTALTFDGKIAACGNVEIRLWNTAT